MVHRASRGFLDVSFKAQAHVWRVWWRRVRGELRLRVSLVDVLYIIYIYICLRIVVGWEGFAADVWSVLFLQIGNRAMDKASCRGREEKFSCTSEKEASGEASMSRRLGP